MIHRPFQKEKLKNKAKVEGMIV